MTTTETPKQEVAREKAEDKAAAARPTSAPYSAPYSAPLAADKTQTQKDWEAEIARMNARKAKAVVDTAGAEKLRAEIAAQPNPSDDFMAERERLGMIALARAAAMVRKRKHEDEARIREANDQSAIS